MAIGTIIMGIGFLFMAKASLEVLSTGEAALVWIILAYLLHTLGELSTSPVALSFITKIAPAKYVSIMMGVYFAATGLGNKVAGAIGEASQTEPIYSEVNTNYDGVGGFIPDSTLAKAGSFNIAALAFIENGEVVISSSDTEGEASQFVQINDKNRELLKEALIEEESTRQNPQHITINYENAKDFTAIQAGENVNVSMGNYSGEIVLFEASNKRELRTFIYITAFTAAFGLLLILFLKKLKKLTHGAEEAERDMGEDEEEAQVDAH